MKINELTQLYKESILILECLHQRNVERYESGKSDSISTSAIEFRDIVEQTFTSRDLRGLKCIRKDLNEISKGLPVSVRKQLSEKLANKN